MKNISELFSLKGKTAVVTGGAVNIGRAVTLRLASAGASLAVIYHSGREEAEKLESELEESGVKHLLIRADLRKEKEIITAVEKTAKHFGRIDILVNNAGVFGLSEQSTLSAKDWDYVFDLNVKGLFLMSREVLKTMEKHGKGGSIINIASINGLHPGFGLTAHYDAAKGAVIAYTKSLAAEVAGKGIRVNAVAPGLVDSETLRKEAPVLAAKTEKRTPLQKLTAPEDVADTVLFLASSAAAQITGETIIVDGGYLLT
jgi:3-oxoacyl-[acyl-carrier protein] reductase